MDFYDVVGQVLELLQRQKRVSYRALKLQLKLDDDYIEGLKDELIYAKKLAVDEDNRVLVWVGDTDSAIESPTSPATTEPASQPDLTPQPEPQPIVEQAQLAHVETPPVEPCTPDAERRRSTTGPAARRRSPRPWRK